MIQVARPLPPNPLSTEESSPSQISRLNHIKPPLNKASVSSARERRRRNKKEGGLGRGVILKSRSAADLCRVERKKGQVDCERGQVDCERGQVDCEKGQVDYEKGQVDCDTPPDGWKTSNKSAKQMGPGMDEPDSETRLGMDELDSDCQIDKEDKPKVEKTEDDHQRMDIQGGDGEADQPDSGPPPGAKKDSYGNTRDKGSHAGDTALRRKEVDINIGRTDEEEEETAQGNPQVQCAGEPDQILN